METIATTGPGMHETNNNNNIDDHDLKLLERLEEANRLIEADTKSLNSLSNCSATNGQLNDSGSGSGSGSGCSIDCSGDSRKSFDTSLLLSHDKAQTPDQEQGQEGDATADCDQETWLQWSRTVNDWDTQWRKRPQQIKEMVRRGVPHHFRGIVWQLLCGAHRSADKAKYAHYIKATSACEKSIRRDIARTYPEHEFFKEKDGTGQESLFNVMKAYSLHDREVGYCQGTAFIVGLLLMQMPEEESFAVLVQIMHDYRMREMFKPSMAELGVCIHQLEVLVQEQLPELYGHLRSQSFHTSMYASSWFLTLFTTALPLPLAARVMDSFLADGIEVIFRLAIAILHVGQPHILSLDMEGMLKYFQKEMPANFEAEPERHFTLAAAVKYNAKRMKKLEKEYLTAKTKEHEDQIELRRLRTENRLLRQQVDYVEAECSALADRLLQGQVCRAEEAEHSYVIRRELEAVRHHSLATADELDQARQRIQKLSEQMMTSASSGCDDSVQSQTSFNSELLQQKEELICCLQDQLVSVRLKHAESEALVSELHAQIDTLQKELRDALECSAKSELLTVQQQLAAAEQRELQLLQSLEQLRSALADLNVMWKRHLEEKESLKLSLETGTAASCADSQQGALRTPTAARRLLSWASGSDMAAAAGGGGGGGRLGDELMTSRLRETQALAELRHSQAKTQAAEDQLHVLQSQWQRQCDQLVSCQQRLNASDQLHRQHMIEHRDLQRRFADLQGKMKEELMLARIRDAEHTQCMTELTQNLCHLELKNQEVFAENELNGVARADEVREFSDKLADLKAQLPLNLARAGALASPSPLPSPMFEWGATVPGLFHIRSKHSPQL